MRIFLTGATGVIGRRVLPSLVALGHGVTAVVHRPQSRAEIERAGGVPVQVARDAIRKAVAGHDAVINLVTHLPAGWRMFLPGAWAENDRIRRIASANLVDAAIAGGATRFIQESFALAYPDRGEMWSDERTPLAPVRYNRSVIDAERSTQRFSSGGRTGVVLRFAAFYGADSWFTRDLISYVRRGFVPIPGAAESYISSVSHDDAAAAVMGAILARAGAYNVIDDEPMSRREFLGSLAEALGVPAPGLAPPWMKYAFGSLGEMLARSLRISNRKLREECAWVPKHASMRQGWRRCGGVSAFRTARVARATRDRRGAGWASECPRSLERADRLHSPRHSGGIMNDSSLGHAPLWRLGGAVKGRPRGKTMRPFALALTLSLAASAVASAQTGMPDSENGRYSFTPVVDGALRLDTRTGQVSHCSRSDAGWTCKVVPDERSALETEIARLQGENGTLKKELLARGLPVPGVPDPSGTKPGEPELKLPSDAEVNKVISFLEKVWRRLIEMGRNLQKEQP